MNNKNIIGREKELNILNSFYKSHKAEFLAIYGRRRVGKTYLIQKFFEYKDPYIFFHITGQKNTNMRTQIDNFSEVISKTFMQSKNFRTRELQDWNDAFQVLTTEFIEKVSKKDKVILFFDELPWLASPKSGFLEALDYFWNRYWSNISNLKLVICGSAASWIINNIINNKGGLHNRITKLMVLEPFTLHETKQFLKSKNILLDNNQIVQLYMTTGGVALYLDHIEKGLSATDNIDDLCFQRDGLLFNEFNNLFSSLFSNSESYEELVTIIATNRYGISQSEILKSAKLSSNGGSAKKKLQELEEAGFIISLTPYKHKQKGIYYKIIDEYTLFYLVWILPIKKNITKRSKDRGYWLSKSLSPGWKSWSGYAFEALCFKHIDKIRNKLKISPGADISTWRYSPRKNKVEDGAQIDLLFDRDDDVITICEIKYYNKPFVIDKNYYNNILNKISVFKKVTKTKKQILIAFITKSGLKENSYSEKLGCKFITLDDILG